MTRARMTTFVLLLLMTSMVALSAAAPQGSCAPAPTVAPMASGECNFTFLVADAVDFGSTAWRVHDGTLDIFIEAFPAASACQWKPAAVTKADIIIQEYHGHNSHYDPASVATVAKNTGAVVVGNAQVKTDMLARGVSASKIVELSPALGGKASATVLGCEITAYGMVHSMMTTTQVDTYLVKMPSGTVWFHGTCAAASCEGTYMTGAEFDAVDVMILDYEHSPTTANGNFHPQYVGIDHNWDDTTHGKIYEGVPSGAPPLLQTLGHNQTFTYFPPAPNVLPELTGGTVTPTEGTEDTDFAFKVFYRDPDTRNNAGPKTMWLRYRNAGGPEVEAPLSAGGGVAWDIGDWLTRTTKLAPGQYTFRFNVSDPRDGCNDTGYLPTVIDVRPRNKSPELQTPTFQPATGRTGTVFRFDVMYRDQDNDPPTSAVVYIDGAAHDLVADSPDGPWNSWGVYYCETTLPVGEGHRYYFMFSDGKDGARLPRVTDAPNWLVGPDVLPPNYAPMLTTAMSSPMEGSRATMFTVSVIYTDQEGGLPTVSTVYIDGVPHLLMGDGANYALGVKFSYRSRLALGTHTLYFTFSDGENDVRLPVEGTMPGPTVVNIAPTAVIKEPRDGTRFAPSEMISFDPTGSEDADGDTLSYIWTSDLDGELGAQGAVDTRLSEGWHNVTLSVDDGNGGVAVAVVRLLVKPYLPHVLLDEVNFSPTGAIEPDAVRITAVVGNDGEARAEGVDVVFLIDGTEVYSDSVSLDVGGTREVSCTWTSSGGEHVLRVEAGAAIKELALPIRANTLPAATPQVYYVGGVVVKLRPGTDVAFKANASDAETDALAFEWDFGDGTPNGMVRDPTHAFAQAGTYTVTLKVTDARGGVTTRTVDVVVEKAPKEESPGLGVAVALAALGAVAAVALASGRRRA
jgi:hypothetical protein